MNVSPYVYPGMPNDSKEISEIKTLVCSALGVPIDSLIKKTRKREIVFARQVSVYIIKDVYPQLSMDKIRSYFGYSDHTTVMHCVNTIRNDMNQQPYLKELIERILKQLK